MNNEVSDSALSDNARRLAFSAVAGLMTGIVACSATKPNEVVVDPNATVNTGTAAAASADPNNAAETVNAEDIGSKKKKTDNANAITSAKNCCAGKNDCKGLGSCKANGHECKGLNDCKGLGGCRSANCDSTESAEQKMCCKGKNDCKGRGNCKTDKHNCQGKNDCKGRGGCKGPC